MTRIEIMTFNCGLYSNSQPKLWYLKIAMQRTFQTLSNMSNVYQSGHIANANIIFIDFLILIKVAKVQFNRKARGYWPKSHEYLNSLNFRGFFLSCLAVIF